MSRDTVSFNANVPLKRSLAFPEGKFVEVWKKQADGQWKVVADMFSSDLPAPGEQK